MALKPAICTQCGGKLEVDDSKEAGICPFCGTAFITEKVINQYVTQNNFAGATINIQGGVDTENLYKLARRAYELQKYNEALDYYTRICERNPDDWEAVFYGTLLKGDIAVKDLNLVTDLICNNPSVDKKYLSTVFTTVINDIHTYYWNDENNLLDALKHLIDKNDASLNSVTEEICLVYINRKVDKMPVSTESPENQSDIEEKNFEYHRLQKRNLLNYFKEKGDAYSSTLNTLVKANSKVSFNWTDVAFYEELLKDTSYPWKSEFIEWSYAWMYEKDYQPAYQHCLFYCKHYETLLENTSYPWKNEYLLKMYQKMISDCGENLSKKTYKTLIKKAKEIDATYIPPKRKSSPEKRKAKEIRISIAKFLFKFFLLIIPILFFCSPILKIRLIVHQHPLISIIISIVYWVNLFKPKERR